MKSAFNKFPSLASRLSCKAEGFLAATLALVALHVSTPARAQSVSLGYANGNSTTISGPGIKLDLSAISAFESADLWELTSFTWLSTQSSGAEATGRGYILVFDAALFSSPANLTYATVNDTTTGLVAKSEMYSDGGYAFSSGVILDSGKTYYILNSTAITTSGGAAPYQYGFNSSVSLTGIERWQGNASTWAATASTGVPNFAATFAPIPEPASTAGLFGLVGMACLLARRRR